MKNILVTGASGLLGSHIVKHLLNMHCHIIVSILPGEKSAEGHRDVPPLIFRLR